jgi:hypothetical protein
VKIIFIVVIFQTDYAKGFGGKFGVQTDRVDKMAHTFDEQPDKGSIL